MFFEYPSRYPQLDKGTAYDDYVYHALNYQSYLVRGSQTSSAHECSHKTHADIRNARGANYSITVGRPLYMQGSPENPILVKTALPPTQKIQFHNLKDFEGERVNAIYCGKNRAITLKEPNIKKSSCIPFLPRVLREYRYTTYIEGQRSWDNEPLYVEDEHGAYINGTLTGLDIIERGGNLEWTDLALGPLEFNIYITAILMSAEKAGELYEKLIDFIKWQLIVGFNAFFKARKHFPWDRQDTLLHNLQVHPDGANMRSFMKTILKLEVPDDAIDPDDPDEPDKELSKDDFYLM